MSLGGLIPESHPVPTPRRQAPSEGGPHARLPSLPTPHRAPSQYHGGGGGTAAWAPAPREALSLSTHRYTRCKHTQAASNVALHCKNLRY